MFANALTERMAAFVRGIGIDARTEPLPDGTFLPGLDIRYPGDLLHVAGHVAVAPPEQRAAPTITPGGGDEMAALAWSYARPAISGSTPASPSSARLQGRRPLARRDISYLHMLRWLR